MHGGQKWLFTTLVQLLLLVTSSVLSIQQLNEVVPCRIIKPISQQVHLTHGKFLGRTLTFNKPDTCCGLKPFNSHTHQCCVGKVLSREQFKCCVDGNYVPKESICLCHPSSSWVVQQIKKLNLMEVQLSDFVINCLEIAEKLHQKIVLLQEEVEFMDRKAEDLHKKLVTLIGGKTNADPLEVEHIIKLVLFLNENEESIESVKKNMNVVNDEWSKNHTTSDKRQSQLRTLRSAVQWSRKIKVMITQEIQVSLEDERNVKRTQQVVVEREQILDALSVKNQILQRYNGHLDVARAVVSIADSDVRLSVHLQALLDSLLTVVTRIEKTLKEEASDSTAPPSELLKAAFMSRDVAFESDIFGSLPKIANNDHHGTASNATDSTFATRCDFTQWDAFVKRIADRIPLVEQDIESLKGIDDRTGKISGRTRSDFFRVFKTQKVNSLKND